MSTGAVIVAAIAAVAGTAASVQQNRQQKKANRAQRRATAEARRMEEMERQAEARERYRQMRRDRASTLQQVEYLGAADSTSGQGAVNTTRTAYNISAGFSNATNAIANRMNMFTDQANKYNYRGQMWGAVSNTAWNTAGLALTAGSGFGKTGTTETPNLTENIPTAGGTFTSNPWVANP